MGTDAAPTDEHPYQKVRILGTTCDRRSYAATVPPNSRSHASANAQYRRLHTLEPRFGRYKPPGDALVDQRVDPLHQASPGFPALVQARAYAQRGRSDRHPRGHRGMNRRKSGSMPKSPLAGHSRKPTFEEVAFVGLSQHRQTKHSIVAHFTPQRLPFSPPPLPVTHR